MNQENSETLPKKLTPHPKLFSTTKKVYLAYIEISKVISSLLFKKLRRNINFCGGASLFLFSLSPPFSSIKYTFSKQMFILTILNAEIYGICFYLAFLFLQFLLYPIIN